MYFEETSIPSPTPTQLRSHEQVGLKSDLGLGISLAYLWSQSPFPAPHKPRAVACDPSTGQVEAGDEASVVILHYRVSLRPAWPAEDPSQNKMAGARQSLSI